jgi:hypothetical protein
VTKLPAANQSATIPKLTMIKKMIPTQSHFRRGIRIPAD